MTRGQILSAIYSTIPARTMGHQVREVGSMDVDTAHQSSLALALIRAVTVRVSREFAVPSERLFTAWADPAARECFLPIVCGSGAEVLCVEIEPPHRLTFDVHAEGGLFDRVTVELAPLERGTLLVLIHETGIHRAPDRASLEAAWNASLVVLEACLRSQSNSNDPDS
jgi:uncharacterized protein YndB with AHSA1/START domain